MEHKHFFRQVKFILPISLFILLIASPIGAQTDYPYKVVTPNYIEANTPLVLTGNDASSLVDIGFLFTFYGVTYSQAYVNTNGFISFLVGNSPSLNYCILKQATPKGSIYAFWDDLYVDAEASVRTERRGSEPNRQFVIEWRNVTFNNEWIGRIDFEIVLYEKGAILLQYRNIDDNLLEKAGSATIGLKSPAGDAYAQYSCNAADIKPGEFAILFGNLAKDVSVDIKPGACPNPLNLVSKGVLNVAILGTADFDVRTIDPATVKLNGIAAPLRWKLQDVATPYEPFVGKTDIYQCNTRGPDGNLDIVFKFDTEDVAAALVALGDVTAGQPLILKLDGKLKDGTEIKGEDSAVIIRGHREREHETEHERGHKKGHEKEHDRGHEREHDREKE